jgi:hypothetical protein
MEAAHRVGKFSYSNDTHPSITLNDLVQSPSLPVSVLNLL